MLLTALSNATIFTGDEEIRGKTVLIESDKIKAIVGPSEIPSDAKILDLTGQYIAPGLIDLQIYGGGGYLFSNDITAKALHAIADALVKSGTTGFLITLATNSIEVFHKAIKVVKQNPHPAVLGLHLEGPYINPVKRGAHILEHIKKPERKEVEGLLAEADGVIKMMTLAPEICDPEIIKLLTSHGVVVSAGHSNATYQEAQSGFDNGITTATHLFNAMSPFHHRNTGMPGAVYQSDSYASIIADGIHVDYPTLAISKKIMGNRLFLITDAVEETLEGAYVHVREKDRFTLPDGTLSGSSLTLPQAVKNCVEHAGISLPEAIKMASAYPARILSLGAKSGFIKEGYKANLTLFDKQLKVQGTYVAGVSHQ